MGCKLINLTAKQECGSAEGGVVKAAVVDCTHVEDFIFSPEGKLTSVVVNTVGAIYVYEFDDDDTAFYNQPGNREGNKFTTTQQGFFKCAGVDDTSIEFANCIKDCCCLYTFWEFTNGITVLQGVDYDKDTGVWKKTKSKLKATPSILSDTGANEDRLEVSFDSVGRCFSACTTLTMDDLDAL